MNKRLYIGNLSYSITEPSQLEEIFTEFGFPGGKAHIVMDREMGRPRGFAFIELASEADAQNALTQMNGAMVAGRTLKVAEANERERTPRSAGSSAGGGGGNGHSRSPAPQQDWGRGGGGRDDGRGRRGRREREDW